MLAIATFGYTVNLWASALLSPLAPRLKDHFHLSSFQQAVVVAVPVILGSLGRIPVGALSDRFGGRVMFPVVSLATIAPVLFIGLLGERSFTGLLIGGVCLGVAGTAFAVGAPFVNQWFSPASRGLALGVFGMGIVGNAIAGFTTLKLVAALGFTGAFTFIAIALAAFAMASAFTLRDAPGRIPASDPILSGLAAALRLRVTLQALVLYSVVLGGFIGFAVYLPAYLKTGYGVPELAAANSMAAFVLVTVLMRPVGGWVSDRHTPTAVLSVTLAVAGIGALILAMADSASIAIGTLLAMGGAFGAASGATLALVAMLAPPQKVGRVSGVISAGGGLSGFLLPLLMGYVYGRYGSYRIGLLAFALVALTVVVFTAIAVRRTVESGRSHAESGAS